jgi:hypothetical protein
MFPAVKKMKFLKKVGLEWWFGKAIGGCMVVMYEKITGQKLEYKLWPV